MKGSKLISETNLMVIFFGILSVVFFVLIASIGFPAIAEYMPFFGMEQCPQYRNTNSHTEDLYNTLMNKSMLSTIIWQTVFNCTIAFSVFSLRNVDDHFNNKTELIMFLMYNVFFEWLVLFSLLYATNTWFVSMGFFLYFKVALCAISLYLSGIKPVINSEKPNNIIPFPLNETTIASVESAI